MLVSRVFVLYTHEEVPGQIVKFRWKEIRTLSKKLVLILAVFAVIIVPASLVMTQKSLAAGSSGVPVTWNPTPSSPDLMNFDALSCTSIGFCMTGGMGQGTLSGYWNLSSASISFVPMSSAPMNPNITSISCDGNSSPTLCMAVTHEGDAEAYSGGVWTSYSNIDASNALTDITSVSCTGTTVFCMAVDYAGYSISYSGGTWSTSTLVASSSHLLSVSCASATMCLAGNSSGDLYEWNGSTWAAPSGLTNPVDSTYLINSISCPTISFCMAVDSAGNALVVSYVTSWSITPTTIDSGTQLTSVSCPAIGFCAAVDITGKGFTFSGSSGWSSATLTGTTTLSSVICETQFACIAVGGSQYATFGGTWSTGVVSGSSGIQGVSCVSASFCMEADQSGDIFEYNGSVWSTSGWTNPILTSNPWHSISCFSISFCVAVGGGGYESVFSGSTWSTPTVVDSGRTMVSVSCYSSSACMAVDSSGYAVAYSAGTWTPTSTSIDGSLPIASVACTTVPVCVAIEQADAPIIYSGGSWALPGLGIDSGQGVVSISCPTSVISGISFCGVVDGNGASTGNGIEYNGSTWTSPFLVGGGSSLSLQSVSCPAPGVCVAVGIGGTGAYLPDSYAGGWTSSGMISIESSGNPLSAVSCATTEFCVAGDGSGYADIMKATWSTTPFNIGTYAQAYTAVSCPSTTMCLAGDTSGQYSVYSFTGSPSWTAPIPVSSIVDGDTIDSISCPTISFCMAVNASGLAMTYSSGSWSSISPVESAAALVAVSCASSSSCEAVSANGDAYTYSGSWTADGSIGTGPSTPPTSMSCPTTSLCMVVGLMGTVEVGSGTSWTSLSSVDGTNELTSVSCASSSVCTAVDSAGNVVELAFSGSWTPTLVPVDSVSIKSISCPTTSFCMTVDSAGKSYYGSGTTWAAATVNSFSVPQNVVSCPSPNFCAAASQGGQMDSAGSSTSVATVLVSPNDTGDSGATYTVKFTTSADGALTPGVDYIKLSAYLSGAGPVFLGNQSTASDFSVNGVVASSVSSPDNGDTELIQVPSSATGTGASSVITVVIHNVQNPSTAGSYSLDVATSQDQATVSSSSFSITTGVYAPSVSSNNTAALQSATYTAGFTPMASLVAGVDTITLDASVGAPGTVFPSSATSYQVSSTGPLTSVSSVTVTNGGATVTLVTPVSTSLDVPMNVRVMGVTNPVAGSGLYISISTSQNQALMPTPTYAIYPGVSKVSVANPTPNEASYSGASYVVGFTTSSTGVLTGGSSFIILTGTYGASGISWPTLASDYVVNSVAASSVSVASGNVTIYLASGGSIASSTGVTVDVTGVTNPSSTSLNDYLQVSTSSDTALVASNNFVIAGTPVGLAINPPSGSITASTIATTPLSVYAIDSSGFPADVTASTVVSLSASPAGSGTDFSVTSGGPAVTSVTIPADSYNITVYFGDTQSGTVSIGATATSLSPGSLSVNVAAVAPPPTTSATTISLTSSTQTAKPGASVVFTATVENTSTSSSSPSGPVSGATVSFDVSSGPEAGKTGTSVTNSSGQATFTLTNSGVAGTDTVSAGTVNPSTGQAVLASASVTFSGQDTITLSPTIQGADVGQTVTVTANAVNPSGVALVGVSVTFSVTSGPDSGASVNSTTDTKGESSFTLAAVSAGTDVVLATLSNPTSGSVIQASPVDVKWAPKFVISNSGGGTTSGPLGPGSKVTLSVTLTSPASSLIRPQAVVNLAASSKSIESVIHTSGGNVPDVGVPVDFSITSGPNSGKAGTTSTNSAGTASWSYTGSGGAGTDAIVASFTDSAGLVHTTNFTVTWVLASTTTSTSTTLITTTTTTTPPSTTSTSPPSPGTTVTGNSLGGSTSYIAPSSSPPPGPPGPPQATTPTSASTASSAPATVAPDLSHQRAGSKSTLPTQLALGPGGLMAVGGITNNSNGAKAPVAAVKALVKAGQTGPAMPYSSGYGIGLGGGPPGPAPLARSIPTPLQAFHSFNKTVKGNGLITFVLIFLIGLPALVFNSALKEHHDALAKSRGPIRRAVSAVERFLNDLHGAVLLGLFSIIGAVLYALDDPSFGLNLGSLAEIVGYVGAIVVSTSATEVLRGIYVHRRFSKVGDLRAYPLGIVIAVAFDVFSRVSHFEPGYVFGILAAMVFRVQPTGEEDGRSLTYSSLWLLGLSALAWVIFGPVNTAVVHGNHSFAMLATESLLSYVWICGLQSLFFGLIPARYMDGHSILVWSKAAWVSIYVVVTFIFVQFIVHPSAAGYGGNSHTKILPLASIFIVSAVGAGVFWLYTHFKWGRVEQKVPTKVS